MTAAARDTQTIENGRSERVSTITGPQLVHHPCVKASCRSVSTESPWLKRRSIFADIADPVRESAGDGDVGEPSSPQPQSSRGENKKGTHGDGARPHQHSDATHHGRAEILQRRTSPLRLNAHAGELLFIVCRDIPAPSC